MIPPFRYTHYYSGREEAKAIIPQESYLLTDADVIEACKIALKRK